MVSSRDVGTTVLLGHNQENAWPSILLWAFPGKANINFLCLQEELIDHSSRWPSDSGGVLRHKIISIIYKSGSKQLGILNVYPPNAPTGITFPSNKILFEEIWSIFTTPNGDDRHKNIFFFLKNTHHCKANTYLHSSLRSESKI